VGVNCHPLSSGPELGATHLHAMAVKLQLFFSLLVTESPDKCVSEREREIEMDQRMCVTITSAQKDAW
jgi:hypothetical protein